MTSKGPMVCMKTLKVESGPWWSPVHTNQASVVPHTQPSWAQGCHQRLATRCPEVASWYQWANHPETTAPKQTSSLSLLLHQTPARETKRRTQQRPSRVLSVVASDTRPLLGAFGRGSSNDITGTQNWKKDLGVINSTRLYKTRHSPLSLKDQRSLLRPL